MSIKGCGKIGTKAKHHLKGCRRQFNPRIVEDIKLAFPTNITDFSRSTADKSFRNEFAENS